MKTTARQLGLVELGLYVVGRILGRNPRIVVVDEGFPSPYLITHNGASKKQVDAFVGRFRQSALTNERVNGRLYRGYQEAIL